MTYTRGMGETPPPEYAPGADTPPGRCKAAGGFYTVFPLGHPNAGAPACRFTVARGTRSQRLEYRDALTRPETLRRTVANAWDDVGDVAVSAANTADEAARTVLAAPRDAVGTILGIPPWAVTALGLAAGYLLVSYAIWAVRRQGK